MVYLQTAGTGCMESLLVGKLWTRFEVNIFTWDLKLASCTYKTRYRPAIKNQNVSICKSKTNSLSCRMSKCLHEHLFWCPPQWIEHTIGPSPTNTLTDNGMKGSWKIFYHILSYSIIFYLLQIFRMIPLTPKVEPHIAAPCFVTLFPFSHLQTIKGWTRWHLQLLQNVTYLSLPKNTESSPHQILGRPCWKSHD